MVPSPPAQRAASEAEVSAAVSASARLGPFFEVDAWRPAAGWLRLDELVTTPALLVERVETARAAIARPAGRPAGSVEPRVAASIVFLGLAARLVSPALAATVLTGMVPGWTVGELWWRPVAGGPWPLAASAAPGRWYGDPRTVRDLREVAGHLAETVVSGVVAPVLEAFGDRYRVSRKILTGNVASGLGGAVGMLASAEPDRAELGYRLAEHLMESGPLRGAGRFVRPDQPGARRSFVRRSCCLFYRVPGAGTCGDCVLTAPEARHRGR